MEKNTNKKSQTVDLVYLFRVLRTHLVWILVIAVLSGAVFGAIRLFVRTNDYETEVKFIINGFKQNEEGVKVNVDQMTSSTYLAHSFPDLLKSNNALTAALNNLRYGEKGAQYTEFTTDDIRDRIVRVSVDNQVVTVHVSDPDPAIAADVARAIEQTIPGVIDYYLGIANAGTTETRSSVVKVLNGPDDIGVEKTGMGVLTFIVIGAGAGFLISFFIFFLLDYFDTALYAEDDLRKLFSDIAVIGQIPTWTNDEIDEAEKKAGGKKPNPISRLVPKKKAAPESLKRDYEGRLLSPTTPFRISEAFKLLRTNLCYTTRGDTCAVYAVTSAYIGAGKSVVTANTAISFAQMGKHVLVIDGDLRCPVQRDIFKLPRQSDGLSEALAGVCALSQVHIHKDRYPGLDVISSGRIPPNPAELLASDRMRELIESLKTKYDVIFIDLPPVCQVSDAGAICGLVTGYTFVVRAARSDRRVVSAAVDTMKGYGASIIGFILNDVDPREGESYYYKSGYSSYGKYGKYGKYGEYRSYRYAAPYEGSAYDTRSKRDLTEPTARKNRRNDKTPVKSAPVVEADPSASDPDPVSAPETDAGDTSTPGAGPTP